MEAQRRLDDEWAPLETVRRVEAQSQWQEKRQEQTRQRQEAERLNAEQLRSRVEAFESRTGRDWDDARYYFWQLASLYDVPLSTFDPDSEAFEVLVRLDAGYELQEQELDLLAFLGAPELKDRLLRIRTLKTEYAGSGNPWVLTTISSLWNKSGRPDLAMQTTGGVLADDHEPLQPLSSNLLAALLTTRGASLRRLLRSKEARQCAMRAIGLDPKSFYPHCLLGGIDVDERGFDAGDASFTRCEELGGRELPSGRSKTLVRVCCLPSQQGLQLGVEIHWRQALNSVGSGNGCRSGPVSAEPKSLRDVSAETQLAQTKPLGGFIPNAASSKRTAKVAQVNRRGLAGLRTPRRTCPASNSNLWNRNVAQPKYRATEQGFTCPSVTSRMARTGYRCLFRRVAWTARGHEWKRGL
jgi:hypothetical protein